MTKTLTTERLREIVERRSPSLRWGEAEQIADECLANREAQPVGVDIERIERHVLHAVACPPYSRVVLFSSLQRLFAAPPAPVVNPEFTGATAVPTFEEWLSTQENKPLGWVRDSMKESYDACRAAMLAQPVSQGCKWTFDEHDSKWDSGCGEAWMFCDGGPTENGVKFCQSCGKPVLLEAATEGGNGA